jgi:hypothetical protein
LPLSSVNCLESVEASTSRSTKDLSRPVQGYLYLSTFIFPSEKSQVFALYLHFLNRRVSNTFLVINDNKILERLCLSGSQIGTVPRHATHNIYTLAVRNSNNAPPILSADLKINTPENSAYEQPRKYSRAITLPLSSVISL